ncbi:MAG: hypothetical protein ACKVX7_06025 [Planctomycetota bacterium]
MQIRLSRLSPVAATAAAVIFVVSLASVVLASFEAASLAFYQETPTPEKKPKPQQVGLTDDTKLESRGKECPDFVWQFPKAKKGKDAKNLTDRWAIVDLAKRKAHIIEEIDKEIETAKLKPEENKALIEELESRRMRTTSVFNTRFLQIEVKDNPEQFIILAAERVTRDRKLKDEVPNPNREISDSTTIVEKDITSKEELKKGRGHYLLEATGANAKGERVWRRWNIWLIPVPTGNPFKVTMIQNMPESLRNEEYKKEQQQLEGCLRM